MLLPMLSLISISQAADYPDPIMPAMIGAPANDGGVGLPASFDVEFDSVYLDAKGQNKEVKAILNGISGSARRGEILAIMGASGSGKSSLLNCQAHRSIGREHTGDIRYSGWKWGSAMKRALAYCEQTDVLWDMCGMNVTPFTVKSELLTQARLNLPAHLSDEERIRRVDDIIGEMGLTDVADSKLATLSGGQKRRVSIAMGLLSEPKALFLDEPTSGLDSSTALAVMTKVKEIAEGGMTVVCSIHQPSAQIFNLIDRLMLLSDGHVIYHGKADEAVQYFVDKGIPPPGEFTAPDYLIKIIQDGAVKDVAIAETIRRDFGPDRTHDEVLDGIVEGNRLGRAMCTGGYPTVMMQFRILCGRWWALEDYPDKQSVILQIGTTGLLSLLFVGMEPVEHDLPRYRSFCFMLPMFAAMNSMFGVFNVFNEDELKVRKELASGSYRLIAYYLSRTLMKIPVTIGWPTLMASVLFWSSGISTDVGKFSWFVVVNTSTIVILQSFGWAIGASFTPQNAMTAFPLLAIYMFLFTGQFGMVVEWLDWLKYGNVLKFIVDLMTQLIVGDMEFTPTTPIFHQKGEAQAGLMSREVEYVVDDSRPAIRPASLWVQFGPTTCAFVMLGWFVVVRILAYIGLLSRFRADASDRAKQSSRGGGPIQRLYSEILSRRASQPAAEQAGWPSRAAAQLRRPEDVVDHPPQPVEHVNIAAI